MGWNLSVDAVGWAVSGSERFECWSMFFFCLCVFLMVLILHMDGIRVVEVFLWINFVNVDAFDGESFASVSASRGGVMLEGLGRVGIFCFYFYFWSYPFERVLAFGVI